MSSKHEAFFTDAVARFNITQVGCLTRKMIPYVRLEDGTIFYGLPARKAQQNTVNIILGILDVVADIEYRYFQTGREQTQHDRYVYKSGDVVVELGAYIGYYAMNVARQIGPSGKIVAVELVPDNYEILKMNLMTNFPETAVALNRGVLNRTGPGTAFSGGEQIAGFREEVVGKFTRKAQRISVETDTVDNILRENRIDAVDLMIVQVNGSEIQVLEGADEFIGRIKNIAIAAPYREMDDESTLAQIVSRLEDRGFAVDIDRDWIYGKRT